MRKSTTIEYFYLDSQCGGVLKDMVLSTSSMIQVFKEASQGSDAEKIGVLVSTVKADW